MKTSGFIRSIILTVLLVQTHHCYRLDELETYQNFNFHNSVYGQVIDNVSKEPIDSAFIRIWATNGSEDILEMYTDESGRFVSWKFNIKVIPFVIEASKWPDYLTTFVDGDLYLDSYEENTEDFYRDKYYVKIPLDPTILDFKVIPDQIDFGIADSLKSIALINSGTIQFSWILTTSGNFITTSLTEGTLDPASFEIIDININRGLIDPGDHTFNMEINTSAGMQTIPILVSN